MSTSAAHKNALLLTFETHMVSINRYRYTNNDRNLDVDGKIFTSAPIKAKLNKQTGRLEDEPIEIEVGYIQPLVDFVNYPSHAPVEVTLEMIPLDVSFPSREQLWRGRMGRLTLNPDGREGVISFEVPSPLKYMSDRPMGIACGSACAWRFGDKNCRINLSSLEVAGTVTAIDGLNVTISGLDVYDDGYFARGFLRIGGLKLMITDHSGTTLTLARGLPNVFLSTLAKATPGCDKSLGTCRTRWNNEVRFGGFGYAIPTEDPTNRGF